MDLVRRQQREAQEANTLASYAVRSSESRGRKHSEPPDADRSCFQRDSDRVLHCSAFRRLGYKTQAFVNHEGDHYRTRLTHTLEVSRIGRSLALLLGVNHDLTECICLAHDLGHAPFGHAGEEVLDEQMRDEGGFEHNRQSLRVVDELEHPYPQFHGLNLSYEVREGLALHKSRYDAPKAHAEFRYHRHPSMEGQIADLADSLAYTGHDVDDALTARLISPNDLQDIELWQRVCKEVQISVPRGQLSDPAMQRRRVSHLLKVLLNDVSETTMARLASEPVRSPDAVRQLAAQVVVMSDSIALQFEQLQQAILERVYRHHRLIRMDRKAKRFIRELFENYLADPKQLPPRFSRRIDAKGSRRVICDYIAGMTDRYCQDEYNRLFAPFERS